MLTEIHDYKIRPAEDDDLGMIAEILYRHYQAYDWWQAVNSEVEPTTWLRDVVSTMRDDSRKGTDGAWLFLEGGGVVAGALCYVELKRTLDPPPERDSSPGENAFEAEKLDNSSFKYEMVAKYNKVLWLSELAVQTDFLGKGAAKFMMRFIIDEAKKQELNVAAAVVADEVEWYRAWGFQEVHPVRMLLNGTVPAANQMVLELFPVAASCCVQ